MQQSNTISTGVYVIRRRQLIEMSGEIRQEENRFDFVTDVLIRYKNMKRIYGYKMDRLLEQYCNCGCIITAQIWIS